jgi:hypothetical protein
MVISRHIRIRAINWETPFRGHLILAQCRMLSVVRHFVPPFLSLDGHDLGTQATTAQVLFDVLPTIRDG